MPSPSPIAPNEGARHDVLGLGNAIVDVLAAAEEADIGRLGLAKGIMTLVDEARSGALYDAMGPATEASGGSCANTMVGVASLGGRSAYVGRVKDDELGRFFAHDIGASGVHFANRPAAGGPATARSLIFVTPDAQRTMNTYLGACVELGPDDVDEALVRQASITYLEGYLWDRPEAKAACRKAADLCHAAGNKLALTLSDPFCVDRWRPEFRALVEGEVDILFANEAEITSLYEVAGLEEAVPAVRERVALAVLTRGATGSLIVRGDEVHEIAAVPPARLVDTTGAGDLYAAGFLRGLTAGLDLPQCGALASRAASAILAHFGPRPERPLRPLFEAVRGAAGA